MNLGLMNSERVEKAWMIAKLPGCGADYPPFSKLQGKLTL
jgi:hypothetical protein